MTPLTPSERSFARRIDLTSLQLFVAVCELGSIGRAAEREFIAPSAVSKRRIMGTWGNSGCDRLGGTLV